jgi:hypothetical protein
MATSGRIKQFYHIIVRAPYHTAPAITVSIAHIYDENKQSNFAKRLTGVKKSGGFCIGTD